MKLINALALVVMLSLPALQSYANTGNTHLTPFSVGTAYDRGSRQLLYEEHHFISSDGMTHRVEYFEPDGDVLAIKTLDYTSGDSTPSFRQEQYSIGEVLAARFNGDELVLSRNESRKTLEHESDLPLVIDAGFDRFVRERWVELLAGVRAIARMSNGRTSTSRASRRWRRWSGKA